MDLVERVEADCPVCGAAAESGLITATRSSRYGSDLSCDVCGLYLWQGVIDDRGIDRDPAEVIARVREAMPALSADAAYREPWNRRYALGLVPAYAADDAGESASEGADS